MSSAPTNSSQQLSTLFKNACLAELEALKPGNVHIFADGHGMTIQDFIVSAEAVAKVIAAPDLSLGERILRSIEATQAAVACNTNLGIILLCAPLIHAALRKGGRDLRQALVQVLQETTQADAQSVFDAIVLANPAGLGEVAQFDVNQAASVTLLQAMQAGADHDLIALQYANNFEQIFNLGEPVLAQPSHLNLAWRTTKLYLTLLANYPDSHIARKYGNLVAIQTQEMAAVHLAAFNLAANPKTYLGQLLTWDTQLKQAHINPGTIADLTVASLLAANLKNAIN